MMAWDSVERAVRAKHSKDLVVPECKDGPTWTNAHKRLDYWVLKRSWSNPAMIGYEVKRSRSDFLQDDKWPHYLKLCNQLAFIITDAKVLDASELPQDVGLYRVAGDRMLTVRKPVWRRIEPPAALMTYVLMSRTTITRDTGTPEDPDAMRKERAARWAAILRDEDDMRIVGRAVSKRIAKAVGVRLRIAEEKQAAYESTLEQVLSLSVELRRRGIGLAWQTTEQVADGLLEIMNTGLQPNAAKGLRVALRAIQDVLSQGEVARNEA